MLTVGGLLKKTREDKGLTIQGIEKLTKIRRRQLEAIEENQWDKFSSRTYIVGVIKIYSRLLNLDQEKMLAFFRREYEKKDEIRFKKRVDKNYLIPQRKTIIKILFFVISLPLALYFFIQLRIYFSPPKLEIISPREAVIVNKNKIELVGITDKEAIVTVNGERVYQDKNNLFKTEVSLTGLKNEVIIETMGVNGRKKTVKKVFIKK